LKIFNQSLLKKFQSRFGCEMLSCFATLPDLDLRQSTSPGNRFSIKPCLKNFNQGLLKIFQSKLD